MTEESIESGLQELRDIGLATEHADGKWSINPAGVAFVEQIMGTGLNSDAAMEVFILGWRAAVKHYGIEEEAQV